MCVRLIYLNAILESLSLYREVFIRRSLKVQRSADYVGFCTFSNV